MKHKQQSLTPNFYNPKWEGLNAFPFSINVIARAFLLFARSNLIIKLKIASPLGFDMPFHGYSTNSGSQ
ncbi:MAG: hypothetical protein JNM46_10270 [Anaerolineales bacterium]|nr:hypothetical protein [Anaerolineales bacterium]